jgi:hypothetical protein
MRTASLFLMVMATFVASAFVHAADSGTPKVTNPTTVAAPNRQNSQAALGAPGAQASDSSSSQPAKPARTVTIEDIAWIQVISFSLLLLIFFPLIWLRTHKTSSGHSTSVSPADLQAIGSTVAVAVASRTAQLASSQNVLTSEANVKRVLAEMGPRLVESVAKAAAIEVNKTQLGEVTAKCQALEEKLKKALLDIAAEQSKTSAALGELDAAITQKRASEDFTKAVSGEKEELNRKLSELRTSLDGLNAQLISARGDADKVRNELAAEQSKVVQLRSDASKSFDVLAPVKLRDTELFTQMQALYQESLAGNVTSIAAWTTLTTFVSAQADPSAKDFQLQIVRRLGLTLVSYWKHQGLSEKDRHDKLVNWAKSLNEHSDGRYNLLVPSLGEPIDRSRMSCATSVTAIKEVLCWQVRNPSGANFSLAEVA